MKSSSPMKSLMDYAGSYRYLTGAAFALSAISSLTALVPSFISGVLSARFLKLHLTLKMQQGSP